MNEQEVLRLLGEVKAIITDSHIVYTSGLHGSAYVNKDAVYPHTKVISALCRGIAEQFADDGVEVVVAPAIGGVIISHRVADHLSEITGREVLGIYAEHEECGVMVAEKSDIRIPLPAGTFDRENELDEIILYRGEGLAVKKPTFVIKRGYGKLVAGNKVLVVEDILTTGGSARRVIEATRALSGYVVGLGVLCNRGGITPKDVGGVPKLFALVNVKLDSWDEASCPLCKQGVSINTDVGKGKDFLARRVRPLQPGTASL